MRSDPQPSLEDHGDCEIRARAGLLALGSSYSPRLPGRTASGFLAGFVPDHSDGVAADSHRLPWALTGTWTLRQCTLAELGRPMQPSRARLFHALKIPFALRTESPLWDGPSTPALSDRSASIDERPVRGSGLVRQPLGDPIARSDEAAPYACPDFAVDIDVASVERRGPRR